MFAREHAFLSCQSQEFSFPLQLFVSFLLLRGLLPSNVSISAIRGAVSCVRTWDRDRKSELCNSHQVQVDDKSIEFLSTNAKSDFLSVLWGSRGSPAADQCWTHQGELSWHLHYEDTTLRDTHKETEWQVVVFYHRWKQIFVLQLKQPNKQKMRSLKETHIMSPSTTCTYSELSSSALQPVGQQMELFNFTELLLPLITGETLF